MEYELEFNPGHSGKLAITGKLRYVTNQNH